MFEENRSGLSSVFATGALSSLIFASNLVCNDVQAADINLAWNPASGSCATRIYATPTPYGQYEVIKETFEKDPQTNALPTSGSITVPDSSGLIFIYARALFPKDGQNCAQAIAGNAYIFSAPSNFVAKSNLVTTNCPAGSPNRDGDGIAIFGMSGFCDEAEKLTGSSVSNRYSSGNTRYDDPAKYVLLSVIGGLPNATQGAPDPGNALCPNGKMVLKTNECDSDSTSDANQLANALKSIRELNFSW